MLSAAAAWIVVWTLAVLSAGCGSAWSLVAIAELVITPTEPASAEPTIVIVAVAPTPRSPSAQTTVCPPAGVPCGWLGLPATGERPRVGPPPRGGTGWPKVVQ